MLFSTWVQDLKNIHACLKHFHVEVVETCFSIPQPDGTKLEVNRTMSRLHRDAVPKLLPGNKEVEIEASPESIYKLLQVMDRSALKWPSGIVINVLVCLRKIFTSMEQQDLWNVVLNYDISLQCTLDYPTPGRGFSL
ncbi:hypothetical protein LOD99_3360 [Oopsacas minuta]|uniref:Uncharacterized protein n=1 Tax=Oopsacas minuta TaxID=111878 RepID=A0AAV7JYX0_9METZ|nr:hypothetical protein LOD99_3360 [Oopsacas minuta]